MANFSCPNVDASWHVCAGGSQFVGCCTANPCDLGCSAGNLGPASFDLTLYGTIPDLECPKGAQFYTCNSTTPSFWGCCKSNPCDQNGCPDADLSPANLGINPQAPQFYSPTSTDAASASATPDKSHVSTAIIGGAVGGAVGLAVLVGVLVFLFCRRRKRRSHDDNMGAEKATSPENNVGIFGAPPTYSAPKEQFEAPIELDSRMLPPVELAADHMAPVELDARPTSSLLSPPLSPSPSVSSGRHKRKSKRFTGASLSSTSEERQHTLDALLGVGGSPEVSPQSATFAEGGGSASTRYSAVSSLASTPCTPGLPQRSPTIKESDELMAGRQE